MKIPDWALDELITKYRALALDQKYTRYRRDQAQETVAALLELQKLRKGIPVMGTVG